MNPFNERFCRSNCLCREWGRNPMEMGLRRGQMTQQL